MPAFLAAPDDVGDDHVILRDDEAHHVHVRRYGVGDEIDVIDGAGCAYRVRLERLAKGRAEAAILERRPGHGESRVRLHLAAAVPKGARFDIVVEKAVEVGVASITPMVMERGVVKPGAEGQRRERWLRLARAAAKQCGRSRVPEIAVPADLTTAVDDLAGRCSRLLAAGADAASTAIAGGDGSLATAVAGGDADLALFIGPEGGFEPQEWRQLMARGARAFTWGERILRAETAAIVLSALVLDAAERGDT